MGLPGRLEISCIGLNFTVAKFLVRQNIRVSCHLIVACPRLPVTLGRAQKSSLSDPQLTSAFLGPLLFSARVLLRTHGRPLLGGPCIRFRSYPARNMPEVVSRQAVGVCDFFNFDVGLFLECYEGF